MEIHKIRTRIFEIIELDERGDLVSIIYDRIMQIAIIASIIPLMFRGHLKVFTMVEIGATGLFLLDYVLRWITADYRIKKKGTTPFIVYPFSFAAIIDLLTIIPTFSYFNKSLRILRTWRFLRLLRVAKVFKYYEPLQILIDVFRKKVSVLMTVVGFALFYIFITALFMFNVEQSVDPQTGTMFFENFFDALYWSTCTLTTVGYGDIYPTSELGRFISMISSLVGIAIIALPSGIITAGYMEEVQDRKNSKKKE